MPNYAESPHKNPHSEFDKSECYRLSGIALTTKEGPASLPRDGCDRCRLQVSIDRDQDAQSSNNLARARRCGAACLPASPRFTLLHARQTFRSLRQWDGQHDERIRRVPTHSRSQT